MQERMDLFCVNRYYGEDEANSKVNVEEAEKVRLRKLQEKIRKRKKEKSKKIEMGISDDASFEKIVSKRQTKRTKIVVSDESVIHFENKGKGTKGQEEGYAQKEKHKTKKKQTKKNRVASENDSMKNVASVNDSGGHPSIARKEVTKADEPVKKERKIKESKEMQKNIADENMEKNDCMRNIRRKKKAKEITSTKEDENDSKNSDDAIDKEHDEIMSKPLSNDIDINDPMISEQVSDKVGVKEITSQSKTDTSVDSQGTDTPYYAVLGTGGRKKQKQVVKRTLPKWIAEPKLVGADITRGKVAIDEADYLADSTKINLKDNNIKFLFPVQSSVIPYILSQNSHWTTYGNAGLVPRDICVSAPTGSGKTLAYVLPLIQLLSGCVYRRLQALIVLPSKDLAAQVKTVISNHSKGANLKVGLASGVKSFHEEQQQLISTGPYGSVSNVDILVCTPGRLVDHINHTDGFTLERLRFLVVDEADRLLGQAYYNWLDKILNNAYNSTSSAASQNSYFVPRSSPASQTTPSCVDRIELPLQKLLFSATMTQNPEKLAPMQLYQPVLFMASEKAEPDMPKNDVETEKDDSQNERYILPESLTEKMTVCKPGEKPLLVIYLMKIMKYKGVLCFTGSIEETHRLFLLVKSCGISAAEFSSTLNQTQRKGILRDFKTGKVQLLICSDAMSRGMDIENVEYVFSYDPPVNMKTYVHRVGRTARAGNHGTAITILSRKEVYHFKKVTQLGNRPTMEKITFSKEELEPLMDEYENALESLKEAIDSERTQGHK